MNERTALFTRGMIEADDNEIGIHMPEIAGAIQIWSAMQNRRISVAEAAAAFNTDAGIVRDAVREAYWMFLEPEAEADPAKQFIEHEGE